MSFPRLLLAGSHSGSGKTTFALGLMAALARRGLSVQPFKVGPDYIDPSFHRFVTGQASRNLDAWLIPEAHLPDLFFRHAPRKGQGISLIEGVMGLYDGLGTGAFGSTAHIAALLKAPVLLVINAEGLSLSAAALVSGYAGFRPRSSAREPDLDNLAVRGVLLNRVASERHYAILSRCITEQTGIPCLGFLPKNAAPPLPRRHLGLIPAGEQEDLAGHIELLAQAVERHLDIPALLDLALLDLALTAPSASPACPDSCPDSWPGSALRAPSADREPRRPSSPSPVRIGVARDAAFSFYYEDNLEYLREQGAELVFCSPLRDAGLPGNLDGLYLGGGFPEVFATELEANISFRAGLKSALEAGLPAYAECGGMLYLCASLSLGPEEDGAPERDFAMAGFFPQRAAMTSRLQPFGYVTVTLERDCPLGPAGTRFRAHEFHYSRLLGESPSEPCAPADPEVMAPLETVEPVMRAEKADGRTWTGGLQKKNVLAWYPHVHFHGCPEAAQSFVQACREYGLTQKTNGITRS